MKILIAVAVAQGGHVLHPEMISECTDQTRRLFEAVFDLEAQAIEANDLDGVQRDIGAHEQARTPCGVNDGHEADASSGRTPQQITNTIVNNDVPIAVDGAGNLLHRSGISKQRLELYLFAIALGCPSFPLAFLRFS